MHQTMCLKRIQKKKLLGCHNIKLLGRHFFKNLVTPLRNDYLINF